MHWLLYYQETDERKKINNPRIGKKKKGTKQGSKLHKIYGEISFEFDLAYLNYKT